MNLTDNFLTGAQLVLFKSRLNNPMICIDSSQQVFRCVWCRAFTIEEYNFKTQFTIYRLPEHDKDCPHIALQKLLAEKGS